LPRLYVLSCQGKWELVIFRVKPKEEEESVVFVNCPGIHQSCEMEQELDTQIHTQFVLPGDFVSMAFNEELLNVFFYYFGLGLLNKIYTFLNK
jgi:hypothetical protein